MMRLYSFDDIIADVKTHEGAEIVLPEADMEQMRTGHFLKLYSEKFPIQMTGEATVNELTARVKEFLYDQSHVIPTCDILPSDIEGDFSALLYRVIAEPGRKELRGLKLEFIQGISVNEDVDYYLSDKSGETSLCLVVVEEPEAIYKVRNMN